MMGRMRAVSGSDGGTLQVTRSAARKRAGASKESIHPSDSRGRSLIDIRSPAIQMTKTLAAIPAYNEEVAIGSVALRCQRYVDEVLVVDDGSADSTAEVAKLAQASVIRHKSNIGKGAAIQSALAYARTNGFDAVVLLDGDGQHNPSDIPLLLEPVLQGKADLVVGARRRATSHMPLYRRVGQRTLDLLTAAGGMAAVTDSQSGFRALSRAAVESLDLEERTFGIESEMLIAAKQKHLRIASVPIRTRYDVLGSTKGPISHGVGVVDRILRIVAVRHPLVFFSLPGLIVFIAGLWLGFDTLETYNEQHLFATGRALLAIVLLMLGALTIFVGLILNVMPKAMIRTLNGQFRATTREGGK